MGVKPIICPLCEHGHMELKENPTEKPNGREDKSYMWICDECPGILLEWWDHEDTKAFNKYMAYGVPTLEEVRSFSELYMEFKKLDSQLDELERDIKYLLSGPETESQNWVVKAKESKKSAVRILFKEYTQLYNKHAKMLDKRFAEVKE